MAGRSDMPSGNAILASAAAVVLVILFDQHKAAPLTPFGADLLRAPAQPSSSAPAVADERLLPSATRSQPSRPQQVEAETPLSGQLLQRYAQPQWRRRAPQTVPAPSPRPTTPEYWPGGGGVEEASPLVPLPPTAPREDLLTPGQFAQSSSAAAYPTKSPRRF